MSDALPLPPHPNLEQYRKLAKDFLAASNSNDLGAMIAWTADWSETLARLRGLEITAELRRQMHRESERLALAWLRHQEKQRTGDKWRLADAQFYIARAHGFASWPKFCAHIKALENDHSLVSTFERAVDAIVDGDLETLQRMLRDNPSLIRSRSTREHRSTLLHYTSANGVEDFRQRTPANIVAITRFLLESGADVNAVSDAYGGNSTTLGLTATSWHPENAGVQLQLMDLLISHGAQIDGPDGDINGSLHNGRGEAAELLARHGARLDLEGAAGVGRVDVVGSFFDATGQPGAAVTHDEIKRAFAMACQFGRTEVVDFLLGTTPELKAVLLAEDGLHWAAFSGHIETVRTLLAHGARVNDREKSYDGTALDWALYGWGSTGRDQSSRYYAVIALLAQSGWEVDPAWYQDDEDRRLAFERSQADPRMLAALKGNQFDGP